MLVVMVNPDEKCLPGDVLLRHDTGHPRFIPRRLCGKHDRVMPDRENFTFRIYGVMRRWAFTYRRPMSKDMYAYVVTADSYDEAVCTVSRVCPGYWDLKCLCLDYPVISHIGNYEWKEA